MEYKHGFDGSCCPSKQAKRLLHETFSVGVFQWIPKSNGNGLKRSAVKYRVRGRCDNPGTVYDRATEICKRLDAGEVLYKKSESV